MKCDNCIHGEVCAYENDFSDFLGKIANLDIPDPFIATLNCKFYQTEKILRSDITTIANNFAFKESHV